MSTRQVSLVVSVGGVRPCGLEYGLQDKSGGLATGIPLDDGEEFRCLITVRTGSDGAGVPGGPYVHGKSGDRFLYLSYRGSDGEWMRRTKIALPDHVAATADTLVTRVRDTGTTRVTVEAAWTAAPAEPAAP
ncbi:hypothetical protein GB931_02960 [Modestobacter sp. I12A-02628]|uniref:Uncharacterized protein n=1 Tax=Goekera deserti TaxID=2497753 RepID=A0A7K3WD04_9ACTN|nr:DUF5990 family protein [Goekera deserti]MPQ96898.1 hypothetical protein [Goekera deserti]NDI46789.1 hypothetical protein [Goekera deserti]NEL54358.1 hypothetical protein [Goekera deserti]